MYQVVLFYLSMLLYINIFLPVFLSVLPIGLVIPSILHSSGPLCHQVHLEILYMWFFFSVYTEISVSVNSFLVSRKGYMILHAVTLLVMYILIPSLCMLSSFFRLLAEAVLYSWQSQSIFDLHITLFEWSSKCLNI